MNLSAVVIIKFSANGWVSAGYEGGESNANHRQIIYRSDFFLSSSGCIQKYFQKVPEFFLEKYLSRSAPKLTRIQSNLCRITPHIDFKLHVGLLEPLVGRYN